jgi:hypothetical protein
MAEETENTIVRNIQDPSGEISPEILVAIGMALDLYLSEQTGQDKPMLTIKRVFKPYSPWSSKIYMLRQVPNQFYKR